MMQTMNVVAVYNLKGGVGKTTLAVNLAWSAATLSSRRTLLWDLDPQGGATFLLGSSPTAEKARSVFAKDIEPSRLITPTGIDRLSVLPADRSLRSLDHLLFSLGKRKRLAKLLEGLSTSFDRIILDCPPGLTETSEQVMRSADVILIPVIPSPHYRGALLTMQWSICTSTMQARPPYCRCFRWQTAGARCTRPHSMRSRIGPSSPWPASLSKWPRAGNLLAPLPPPQWRRKAFPSCGGLLSESWPDINRERVA